MSTGLGDESDKSDDEERLGESSRPLFLHLSVDLGVRFHGRSPPPAALNPYARLLYSDLDLPMRPKPLATSPPPLHLEHPGGPDEHKARRRAEDLPEELILLHAPQEVWAKGRPGRVRLDRAGLPCSRGGGGQ